MSEPGDAIHEPFADREHQRHAVELGMWAALAQELVLLAVLFVWYAAARLHAPAVFANGSRATDWRLGVTMTALLLLSSAVVVFALRFAVQHRRVATCVALATTIGLGLAFLAIKVIEYREHILAGQTPFGADAQFWSTYFVATGMHALHVIAAVLLLAALLILALRERLRVNVLIAGALLWHFVDIVWIFLFPLLYLIDPEP